MSNEQEDTTDRAVAYHTTECNLSSTGRQICALNMWLTTRRCTCAERNEHVKVVGDSRINSKYEHLRLAILVPLLATWVRGRLGGISR